MADYLPILILLLLAVLFAALSFVASSFLAPKRPTPAKEAPYECGIVPTREPSERFPVRFYLVAMIFIIFDIEIIFIYPWAVIFRNDLRGFGLIEMVLSAAIIFVPFVYLIANGALDWGPVNRVRELVAARTQQAGRTSESSVRRVGNRPAAATPTDEEAA
jgi:NADH-quinone oxidoreductase subunit A